MKVVPYQRSVVRNGANTLLPSFLGIVVIHDRDTYQPTSLSIM